MPKFSPRPDEAVQFTGPESIEAVADLVRKYRPAAGYDSVEAFGTLLFYDNGHEWPLKLNDWIAFIGGDVVVLPPSMLD